MTELEQLLAMLVRAEIDHDAEPDLPIRRARRCG